MVSILCCGSSQVAAPEVDDLYYLCLFSDMGVRSLRDLRATHLPLLRRIQDVVVPGLAEKHGASASSLLAYAARYF